LLPQIFSGTLPGPVFFGFIGREFKS